MNLINGSGAELLPNLLQVIYAMAAGFLFVMIFYKTKSLIPCILTHGVFNALSVFVNEEVMTPQKNVISCLFMVVVCGAYAWYMTLKIKKAKISDARCLTFTLRQGAYFVQG